MHFISDFGCAFFFGALRQRQPCVETVDHNNLNNDSYRSEFVTIFVVLRISVAGEFESSEPTKKKTSFSPSRRLRSNRTEQKAHKRPNPTRNSNTEWERIARAHHASNAFFFAFCSIWLFGGDQFRALFSCKSQWFMGFRLVDCVFLLENMKPPMPLRYECPPVAAYPPNTGTVVRALTCSPARTSIFIRCYSIRAVIYRNVWSQQKL